MRNLLPLVIVAALAASNIVKAEDTATPSPSPAAAASATPAKKHRSKKAASPAASPAASAAAGASATPAASPTKKSKRSKASPSPATNPASTPAAAGKSGVAPTPMATQAPGGGNGMVWVNSETHVYHKEGSRWYGKTKHGKYMSEADAIKEGDKASKSEK